jgi:glutamyl-tRNA synthetase
VQDCEGNNARVILEGTGMLNKKEVRTRFAPSPTGYMHVGNLRTALYAYLLAKSKGGRFILRIEDTDQERYVDGAVDVIYKTLRDTGLLWDEGPDIGGPVGPYIQSERRDIYKKYAGELVERGGAYYCFCTKERLDEMRRIHEASGMANKYDGHCRRLSKEETDSLIASGTPYVIRQKIPESGGTTFHDEVFGDITTPNDTLDDNVLLKTDGLPTYNFANVVDDHLMGITHVIRGIEYLSSAPKYNLLYEAFGWEIPVYVHCPPVMKDATQKLSKRNGDASFEDLLKKGYLKDAVLNYIALLGWSPGGEREIYTLPEMTEAFDVSGISKSPAIFDNSKLDWVNGEYIRAMSLEEFHEKALPWIKQGVRSETDTKIIAEVLQPRCVKLSDIPEQLDFIDALPDYSADIYVSKKMKTNPQNSLDALKAAKSVLEALGGWTRENIHKALFDLVEELGVKNGVVLWPVRVAVSGKQFTPGGAVEICVMLGKTESLRRIDVGIELLSKRQ